MKSGGDSRPDDAGLIDAARLQAREVRSLPAPELASLDLPGYRLLKPLQRGGQGVVYQAIQERTCRKVAIKFLREGPFADDVAAARFEREILVLGQLVHPNVVTVHACGTSHGRPYYVMDYVPGRPLDRHLAASELTLPERLRLFSRICGAVAAAHRHGVIHRDLKPANVLVDDEGEPHVLDFGLAKVVSPESDGGAPAGIGSRTVTGEFLGSMPWASPEQADGRVHDVDVRSDVYSLGVILYQALTGRFPYRVASTPREVIDNIVNVAPVSPRSLRPEIDDELETIVLRCLSKEPDRRYQSAGELERDVGRYLRGEPIEAKRDSTWYLFRKTVHRHRFLASSAVVALALVVAALAGLTVAQRRESRLRSAAERQARIAEAVLEFLNEDLLSAVRPDEQGRDVTLREVLAVASARVEGEFPDEPLVEAAVRETLGTTYMDLGDWDEADGHLARTLALRREVLGNEAEETLRAMDLLARIHRRHTRYEEAERLHAEMVSTAIRVLGEEHELTVQATSNLAVLLCESGRLEEALERNACVLDLRQRTLGREHPDTLVSMNNQAHYLWSLTRYEEALPLHEEVLAIRRRTLGGDHSFTLISMGNVAKVLMNLGRSEDALPLRRESVEGLRRVLGPRHPETLFGTRGLADCYRRLGRFEEADELLQEVLTASCEEFGDEHPHTATVLEVMSWLYRSWGRPEEAEEYGEWVLSIRTQTLGADHFETKRAEAFLNDAPPLGEAGRLTDSD